jgi:hypothetical protein
VRGDQKQIRKGKEKEKKLWSDNLLAVAVAAAAAAAAAKPAR